MLEPDGSCRIVTGSQDMGQGWRTCAAIMTAEEMGIDYSLVTSPNFATENTQESRSPGGSTVVRGTGTALILACRDAKEQLFKLAITAKKFAAGTTPDQLETSAGNIYLKSNPATTVKIADVCALMTATVVDPGTGSYAYGGPIIGRGSYATARSGNMHLLQQSGVVAEVEVDTDTGETTVLSLSEVVACGRNVFYRGNLNQTTGGMAFMIGHALYAGVYKDEATGLDLNPNYLHFRCPTMADMPDPTNIQVTFNETIEPYGPFGAKGTGEPIMPATTPAILNAIYNACGVRATSNQFTPDKVLAGLGKV
jgi:CO/xanthine dehydrogenase Mo-binding subunit